jgi:hypothetical protein
MNSVAPNFSAQDFFAGLVSIAMMREAPTRREVSMQPSPIQPHPKTATVESSACRDYRVRAVGENKLTDTGVQLANGTPGSRDATSEQAYPLKWCVVDDLDYRNIGDHCVLGKG